MKINAGGDAAESNGITSHLGHSIRPCHSTSLSLCESYRKICFCHECIIESLPFLSHPFGRLCSGGLQRRCSSVSDSQSEIKSSIQSLQRGIRHSFFGCQIFQVWFQLWKVHTKNGVVNTYMKYSGFAFSSYICFLPVLHTQPSSWKVVQAFSDSCA